MRNRQTKLFKEIPKAYGGSLLNTRKGRANGRPLATKQTMHFILKSSQAKGAWSFTKHRPKIEKILTRFARKYGVRLHSLANVGNHLHVHLQLTNRHIYNAFIRSITSAIMMAVTGISRWRKKEMTRKFWDHRPFSRVITSLRDLLNVRDYIEINRIEGYGYTRADAKFFVYMRTQDRLNSS